MMLMYMMSKCATTPTNYCVFAIRTPITCWGLTVSKVLYLYHYLYYCRF
jgi:hypothetical protein